MIAALSLSSGVVMAWTDARDVGIGLLAVATIITTLRWGQWRGVTFATAAVLGFVGVTTWRHGATWASLVLTALAVALWIVIAYLVRRMAKDLRHLNDQLAEHVQALYHQTLHDPLTGLANQKLLLDRTALALDRAANPQIQVALLYLDLDDFRNVNHTLGRAGGDGLLVEIGQRLAGALRATDTAARVGGDEFALLCDDLQDDQGSLQIAERVTAALLPPFVVDGRDIAITASIGIAVPTLTVRTPHELLQDAHEAMNRARARGGAQFDVSNETLRKHSIHRRSTEINLRNAVEREELRLLYQPIIDLKENRISGVEALVRWQHPTRGLLAPAEFISVAESSSLIESIGAWVLEEACGQATTWHSDSGPLTMAINVSERQLAGGFFDAAMSQALDRSGVDPEEIHLEITESAMLQASPAMKAQLASLNERGVSLGVDHLRTGDSSLRLIKDFPLRFLKIAQSFTSRLGDNPNDSALTSEVLSLGRDFGLHTIAEGIETPDQLSLLRELGCRYGQGFHLARPQPAAQIQRLLKQTAA